MNLKLRMDLLISCCLLLFAFCLLMSGVSDIGITYDEPIHISVGQKYMEWLKVSLFSFLLGDFSFPFSREAIDEYFTYRDSRPTFTRAFSGVTHFLFSRLFGDLASFRLWTVFLFSLLIACLYLFIAEIYDRKSATFSALALLFMPRAFGHAHLAALDAPVTALTFFTLFGFYKTVKTEKWKWAILTGITFSLSVSTKITSVFTGFICLIWALFFARKTLWKNFAAFGLVAPVVFFIFWPWLWHDTLRRFSKYFMFHLHFPHFAVYYLGKTYSYAPWHYPLIMTAVTTPAVTLVFFVLGSAKVLIKNQKKDPFGLLILANAFLPLLIFTLPSVPKYNGVRLFLHIFPFLAILSGLGFGYLADSLFAQVSKWKALQPIKNLKTKLVALGLFSALLPAFLGTLLSHPFELSYYNAFIGGPEGALKAGFESTYWGDTYFQVLGFLNENAPENSLIYIFPPGCISLFEIYQSAQVLRRDLKFTASEEGLLQADYAIVQCRQSDYNRFNKALYEFAKPVFKVCYPNSEVPLVCVYDKETIKVILWPQKTQIRHQDRRRRN